MRPRITEEEYDVVKKYRAIHDAAEEVGLDINDTRGGWLKSEKASLFFSNPHYRQREKDIFKEQLLQEIRDYAPIYPIINRKKITDPHLLVIDPADIHVGKLSSYFETGESYDSDIAIQRVMEGVEGILEKAQPYNIEKILFIGGNDVLHIDSPRRVTTSGTPQDTDGMWFENFIKAKKMYVDVIEKLLTVADVEFVYNPSNHDYTNGFFLCQVVHTHFSNNNNISFNTDLRHRKAYLYGENMIGTTHGDGAKQQDLPLLMATEFPLEWSKSKHRYIYTHHIHHKSSKDYAGVTVESLRSPSGTDSWHHRNGYQHAPKAVEGFIHHPSYGQICRISHIF